MMRIDKCRTGIEITKITIQRPRLACIDRYKIFKMRLLAKQPSMLPDEDGKDDGHRDQPREEVKVQREGIVDQPDENKRTKQPEVGDYIDFFSDG